MKKQHSVITFVIHSLQLPKEYNDLFSIEFKRGSNEGMTERSVAVPPQTEVIFEKRFRVPITLYISKKDNTVRRKKIEFTVYRYINATDKKVFGKLEVDVSVYFSDVTVSPKVESFQLESPHSGVSFLTMSFAPVAKQIESNPNTMSEGNLTSMSDAIQFLTDRRSDWDVSDVVANDTARVDSFFEKRAANKLTQSLSDFASKIPKPPAERRRANVPLPQRDGKSLQSNGFSSLSDFLKQKQIVRPVKHTAKVNSEAPEEEMTQQNAMVLLRSVLMKHWDYSPMRPHAFPKAAAAIYAALLYTKVFDRTSRTDDSSRAIIDDFGTKYKTAVVIAQSHLIEKWYISLHLLALVNSTENCCEERVGLCVKYLENVLETQFRFSFDEIFDPFKAFAEHVINEPFEHSVALNSLTILFDYLKHNFVLSDSVVSFINKKVAQTMDKFLVNLLITSATRCTFTNAIQWNTFITMVSDDLHVDLPLFREAVSVLMMAMQICSCPEESTSICPNLPAPVVLRILANQKPDEIMPMINDTTGYAAHFGEEQADSFAYFEEHQHFDFLVKEINTSAWKSVEFDEDTMDHFKYLRKFFIL